MKLSDIKGDRVFDVIADIVDPISVIAKDRKFVDSIAKARTDENVDAMGVITSIIPPLLKDHREEVVSIMAIIHDVSRDEYRDNLTLAGLISDVLDMLGDDELLTFLS